MFFLENLEEYTIGCQHMCQMTENEAQEENISLWLPTETDNFPAFGSPETLRNNHLHKWQFTN